MLRPFFRFLAVFAVALLAPAGALAQSYDQSDYPRFSQAELDQMLAPVALYPDSLLSQLLMAATFPRDIVEAAQWSRSNPGLSGDAAVRAVDRERWDPSVKSLVAFPQVLQMMDERMDWTERLGDAFMTAPEQVSDTIQVLRGRADEAGNLRSGEEMVVRRDYGNYLIEPAAPEVVYVPYYDPRVVYGRWWWPDYEPVYWGPWYGYSWTPGYGGFGWGLGVTLGSGFWYSGFDWPRRYIRFYGNRPHYYRGFSRWYGHRWYSDRDHRRNVRNWRWSGDRRDDRWDGRRDGRRDDRWDGRRDGRRDDRWDGRRVERGTASPDTQRYMAPPASTEQRASSPRAEQRALSPRAAPTAPAPRSYGDQQVERGFERAPQRQYVPQAAPTAPAVIARPPDRQAPAPYAPAARSAPAQQAPVQQAPVQQAAPVAREPRSTPAESRSESRTAPSEGRSWDDGQRGGFIGRSGGRGQQN